VANEMSRTICERSDFMGDESKNKKIVDEVSIQLLLKASEEYFESGQTTVCCNKCQSRIEFEKLGDQAWKHFCHCGKFNGTMRGL
jgi:hypothetical protein